MRPLLLAALLVPALAAANRRPTVQDRYLSFGGPADRLQPEDFPAELRAALEPVRSVQLGCTQPCGEGTDNRRLYEAMLGLAAERLALNASQQTAARALYMPDGRPSPRSPMFAADGAALTQLARSRLRSDLGDQVGGSMTRTLSALGTLQGPGALTPGPGSPGAGFVGADGRPRQPTREELAALASQGVRIPSNLAFANPGSLPAPETARSRERLSEEMARDSDRAFSDPAMRQGARCVLREAERLLARRGGRTSTTGPFDWFSDVTNDRGRISIEAKELMMGYRPGYGGGPATGDNGFSQLCGVSLTHAQLADLDHYFFGLHTGVIPVVGPAMCAGGVLAWDGVKPLFCNWFNQACRDSIAYNWNQVATGGRGCIHGAGTTVAMAGGVRGER